MAGHIFNQIKALIKKDLLLRRRSWIGSSLELFLPIIMIGVSIFFFIREDQLEKSKNVSQSIPLAKGVDLFKRFPKECLFTPNSSNVRELISYLESEIAPRTKFHPVESEADLFVFPTHPSELGMPKTLGLIIDPSQPTSNFTIRTKNMLAEISDEETLEERKKIFDFREFISMHWAISSYELKSNMTKYFEDPPKFETFERLETEISRNARFRSETLKSLKNGIKQILASSNFIVLTVAVKRILIEKKKGSKEFFRMMGVADWTYWLSQFINYFPIFLIQAPIMSWFIFLKYGDGLLESVAYLDFTLMLLMLFTSNLLITFNITTFLNRPVIGQIAVIFTIFIGLYINLEKRSSIVRMFFFPIGLFGNWLDDSIDQIPRKPTSILIDTLSIPFWFVYTISLLYMDAVCPWQTGTVKPFLYPFKWRIKKINPPIDEGYAFYSGRSSKLMENNAGEASIVCSNLTKGFSKSASGKAIENLSIEIKKNQITVLLGHNGAGKTTLMKIITGFASPTSGDVFVNGIDVQHDTLAARRCIAMCPQHECLYENLSVEENLKLCANLRGNDHETVAIAIELLQLEEKASTLASKLSGGMRRRLQLGMALVTDADTIILDEPTSGLDPDTRRSVWDYLLQLKDQKTILITTHFMEEADALADQIVIMSAGHIKCIGSPQFLKNKLGVGYSVRMIKKKGFKRKETELMVKKLYPQSLMASDTTDEIIFNLNVDKIEEQKPIFLDNIAKFCDQLDKNQQNLGIRSYIIQTATLEDVFMKVAVGEGLVGQDRVTFSQVKDTTLAELLDVIDYYRVRRSSFQFLQVHRGLIYKRWNYFRRDVQYISQSCLIPIAIVVLATLSPTLVPNDIVNNFHFPITTVSPDLYSHYDPQPSILFSGSSNSTLRECFREINRQYSLKVIMFDMTIAEYLESLGTLRSELSSEFLFGIQDQGSIEDITLFTTSYYAYSQPIAINNYLNILRCIETGQTQLVIVKEHEYPKIPFLMKFSTESAKRRLYFLFLFPMPLAFLFASIYTFPAIEIAMKVDLMQRMAGLGDFSYWISNLTFDLIYYTLVSEIMIAIIIFHSADILFSFEIFSVLLVSFVVACFAGISFAYLFTFTNIGPSSGFNIVVLYFSLIGAVNSIAIVLVKIVKVPEDNQSFLTRSILLARAVPSFGLIAALDSIFRASMTLYACQPMNKTIHLYINHAVLMTDPYIAKFCLENRKPDYLALVWPDLKLMMIFGLVSYFLVLAASRISHRIWKYSTTFMDKICKHPAKPSEINEDDVEREKKVVEMRVRTHTLVEESLVAYKLIKDYFKFSLTRFRAVHDVSFTVHKRECFGLLGVNGAGKTTTFAILTGDTPMTHGDAFVGCSHITRNIRKCRENMSYCPQRNALLDFLTPVETLKLFARLRGIPEKDVRKNVDYIISSTDLTKDRKTLNRNLSGGNKRKLSLAITAVGGPTIMFLDEPTTGIDPASRRKIWATLIGLRESGKLSMMLTSQSMDECEALCNRIAIMGKGQLRCIGTTRHLKQKYGQGFTLITKLKNDSDFLLLMDCVQEVFPSAEFQDQHGKTIHYHLNDPNLRWGNMFRSMKRVKEKCPIVSFLINPTSIEEIFLTFAQEEFSEES